MRRPAPGFRRRRPSPARLPAGSSRPTPPVRRRSVTARAAVGAGADRGPRRRHRAGASGAARCARSRSACPSRPTACRTSSRCRPATTPRRTWMLIDLFIGSEGTLGVDHDGDVPHPVADPDDRAGVRSVPVGAGGAGAGRRPSPRTAVAAIEHMDQRCLEILTRTAPIGGTTSACRMGRALALLVQMELPPGTTRSRRLRRRSRTRCRRTRPIRRWSRLPAVARARCVRRRPRWRCPETPAAPSN